MEPTLEASLTPSKTGTKSDPHWWSSRLRPKAGPCRTLPAARLRRLPLQPCRLERVQRFANESAIKARRNLRERCGCG